MPQFDFLTFFNQIFWVIMAFSFFYLLSLKTLLPFLASMIKLRNKKLVKFSDNTVSGEVSLISAKLFCHLDKQVNFNVSFFPIFSYSLRSVGFSIINLFDNFFFFNTFLLRFSKHVRAGVKIFGI